MNRLTDVVDIGITSQEGALSKLAKVTSCILDRSRALDVLGWGLERPLRNLLGVRHGGLVKTIPGCGGTGLGEPLGSLFRCEEDYIGAAT